MASYDLNGLIRAASERTGLPADLLSAIVRQESANNPDAVSPVGARGLMQVMPTTAGDPGYGVSPFAEGVPLSDPAENVRFGSDYVARMIDEFDGNVDAALVAYNWGPGNAKKWLADGGKMEDLPAETRGYLTNITRMVAEGRGINLEDLGQPAQTAEAPSTPEPTPARERPTLAEEEDAPEGALEWLGDNFEMVGKSLYSGFVDLASLAADAVDLGQGPDDGITDRVSAALANHSSRVKNSLPEYIRRDLAKEIVTRDENGELEFHMPNLRQVANLVLTSVAPSGAIVTGGRGLVAAGKAIPKLKKIIENSPRAANAVGMGAANSAYNTVSVYSDTYDQAKEDALRDGLSAEEAEAEAVRAATLAASLTAPLSFTTGALGEGLAATGPTITSRVLKGIVAGSVTEAPEEAGQYAAGQIGRREDVELAPLLNAGLMGALGAGPTEGVMAGAFGQDTTAPIVTPDVTPPTESITPDVIPETPLMSTPPQRAFDDVPQPGGPEPLDLSPQIPTEELPVLPERRTLTLPNGRGSRGRVRKPMVLGDAPNAAVAQGIADTEQALDLNPNIPNARDALDAPTEADLAEVKEIIEESAAQAPEVTKDEGEMDVGRTVEALRPKKVPENETAEEELARLIAESEADAVDSGILSKDKDGKVVVDELTKRSTEASAKAAQRNKDKPAPTVPETPPTEEAVEVQEAAAEQELEEEWEITEEAMEEVDADPATVFADMLSEGWTEEEATDFINAVQTEIIARNAPTEAEMAAAARMRENPAQVEQELYARGMTTEQVDAAMAKYATINGLKPTPEEVATPDMAQNPGELPVTRWQPVRNDFEARLRQAWQANVTGTPTRVPEYEERMDAAEGVEVQPGDVLDVTHGTNTEFTMHQRKVGGKDDALWFSNSDTVGAKYAGSRQRKVGNRNRVLNVRVTARKPKTVKWEDLPGDLAEDKVAAIHEMIPGLKEENVDVLTIVGVTKDDIVTQTDTATPGRRTAESVEQGIPGATNYYVVVDETSVSHRPGKDSIEAARDPGPPETEAELAERGYQTAKAIAAARPFNPEEQSLFDAEGNVTEEADQTEGAAYPEPTNEVKVTARQRDWLVANLPKRLLNSVLPKPEGRKKHPMILQLSEETAPLVTGVIADKIGPGMRLTEQELKMGDSMRANIGREMAGETAASDVKDVTAEYTGEPESSVAPERAAGFPEEEILIGGRPAKARPISTDPQARLYREVGGGNLRDLLIAHEAGDSTRGFFSDSVDLALGQGDNRGVLVEVRADHVSGERHRKPGDDALGNGVQGEFRADYMAKGAIQQITISTDAKVTSVERRMLSRLFEEVQGAETGAGRVFVPRQQTEVNTGPDAAPEPEAKAKPVKIYFPRKRIKKQAKEQVKDNPEAAKYVRRMTEDELKTLHKEVAQGVLDDNPELSQRALDTAIVDAVVAKIKTLSGYSEPDPDLANEEIAEAAAEEVTAPVPEAQPLPIEVAAPAQEAPVEPITMDELEFVQTTYTVPSTPEQVTEPDKITVEGSDAMHYGVDPQTDVTQTDPTPEQVDEKSQLDLAEAGDGGMGGRGDNEATESSDMPGDRRRSEDETYDALQDVIRAHSGRWTDVWYYIFARTDAGKRYHRNRQADPKKSTARGDVLAMEEYRDRLKKFKIRKREAEKQARKMGVDAYVFNEDPPMPPSKQQARADRSIPPFNPTEFKLLVKRAVGRSRVWWMERMVDQHYAVKLIQDVGRITDENGYVQDPFQLYEALTRVGSKVDVHIKRFQGAEMKAVEDAAAELGMTFDEANEFAAVLHSLQRNEYIYNRNLAMEGVMPQRVADDKVGYSGYSNDQARVIIAEYEARFGARNLAKLEDAVFETGAFLRDQLVKGELIGDREKAAWSTDPTGNNYVLERYRQLRDTQGYAAAMNLSNYNLAELPVREYKNLDYSDTEARERLLKDTLHNITYVPLSDIEVATVSEVVEQTMKIKAGRNFYSEYDIWGEDIGTAYSRQERGPATAALTHLISQSQQAIIRRNHNIESATRLQNLVEKMNDPYFGIVLPQRSEGYYNSPANVLAEIKRYYESRNMPMPKLPVDDLQILTFHRKYGNKTTPTVLLDRTTANALTNNFNETNTKRVFNAIGNSSSWVRKSMTAWSPAFIATNYVREVWNAKIQARGIKGLTEEQRAAVAAKAGFGESAKWFKPIFTQMMNPNFDPETMPEGPAKDRARLFKKLHEAGMTSEFFHIKDPIQLERELRAVEKALNNPTKNGMKRINATFKKLAETMEDLAAVSENAVRMSVAAEVLAQTGDVNFAASVGKDLSVNFQRYGTWGSAINSLFFFYNPTVQGLYRAKRALHHKEVQKIVGGVIVSSAMLAVLNRALAGEDEEGRNYYESVPEWKRKTNMVIMIPGGEGRHVTIPLPYVWNLPWLATEKVANMLMSDSDPRPKAQQYASLAGDLVGATMEAVSPISYSSSNPARSLVPTMLQPGHDVLANQTWFGGYINPEKNVYEAAPVSDAFNIRDPDSKPGWQAISRALAIGGSEFDPGFIDVSPGTLEYLFKYYTGGAGTFLTRVLDTTVAVVSGAALDEPEQTVADAPLLRRVYGLGEFEQADRDRYYQLRGDLAAANNTLKSLRKDRDREGIKLFMATEGDLFTSGLMNRFESTEKRVRKLRTALNKIVRKKGKTDADQRRIDRLNKLITEAMIRFNRDYYDEITKESFNVVDG